MANTSIYDINKAFQSIVDMVADGELTQEDFQQALAELEQSKVEKCGNAICYLNMRKQAIEAMKAEEKRISTQRKMLEKGNKSLEEAFAYVLKNMGDKEVVTKYGVMKVPKNPPAVVIDDLSKVPTKFQHQKIEVTLDKVAKKNAIKAGEEVAGCHIEQGEKLVY
jgi:transcriptional regulator of heat shock response